MKTLSYKGYIGSVEYSEFDKLFYGKVLGIKSLISYESETESGLAESFEKSVDFYLSEYEKKGLPPENTFLSNRIMGVLKKDSDGKTEYRNHVEQKYTQKDRLTH